MRLVRNKYGLFLAILVVNAIFFSIVAVFLDIRFEENDDVIMCLIANGNYTGIPDYHLVFQNALLGYILSFLYNLTVSIEWYSLFLSIAHIFAVTIIVHAIIQRWKNNFIVLVFILTCLYVLWCITIQSFQFTTTAGLLCIAGCVLLADGVNGSIEGGYLAILASVLVRYEVTIMVLLLFLPLTVLMNKTQWKKYLKVIVAFGIVISAEFVDRLLYDTPEWTYYYEYNVLRGDINDNLNINAVTEKDISAIGIENVDFEMLCGFMPNPQVITLPILKHLNHCIKSIPLKQKVLNVNQLIKYRIPLLVLLLLSLLIVCNVEARFDKFIIVFWYIMCLLLLGILCLEHTLKNRVFLCVLIAMLTFFAIIPQTNPKLLWTSIAIGICLLVISVKYGYQCFKVCESRENKIHCWQDLQLPLLQLLPTNTYVVSLSQLYIEGISPYQVKDFHTKLYPQGWLTTIPMNKEIGNSHADFINSNVYLFIDREKSTCDIANYLESKYNIRVVADTVIQNERYSIIQLKI